MVHQASLFGESEENSSRQGTEPDRQEAKSKEQGQEPLAARMRPRTIDEVIGQEHLLGPGKLLRRIIASDKITSIIFWGPPGSGKTTLAEVIARHSHAHFVRLSAVSAGVADLRKVVEEARRLRVNNSRHRTILFIDEIHRFNKAQQDAVLPHVEQGLFTLIGATTENPSFEVNSALLSRARVFVLKGLHEEQLISILQRALTDKERGLGTIGITIDDEALQQIAIFANGDARTALNVLELAAQASTTSEEQAEQEGIKHITLALVEEVMQHRALQYDKSGDQHYDMISALHKAVRGSDPDGSLYWLTRMLEAGEDPLYIARRVIRMASEDIGLADPQALGICVAAQQAIHFIGMPEGGIILAQAVVYLAAAPKSNALYTAYQRVQGDLQSAPNDPVPLWLRNAPTRLMKDLDYGKEYKYAHDYYEGTSEDPQRPPAIKLQEYLPERLAGRKYYEPGEQGQELSIKRWLEKRRAKDKI